MRAAVGTIWKMPKKLGKQVLDTKLSQEWYALPKTYRNDLKAFITKSIFDVQPILMKNIELATTPEELLNCIRQFSLRPSLMFYLLSRLAAGGAYDTLSDETESSTEKGIEKLAETLMQLISAVPDELHDFADDLPSLCHTLPPEKLHINF